MTFKKWIIKKKIQGENIKKEYEQIRAEKLRKKKPDLMTHKGVMVNGLHKGKMPWDVSRDIIEMRKTKRMMKK